MGIVYLETTLTCSTSSNGQGYEGHEEKGCEQDRKGPHGQSHGVPRIQGEDSRWLDCFVLDQEEILYFQEELLDDCLLEDKEGSEDQGLRRNQEGLRALQEGQGVLLKMLVMASARGVGMSTPFERL